MKRVIYSNHTLGPVPNPSTLFGILMEEDKITADVLAKYENGEALDTDESVVLLTYAMGIQSDNMEKLRANLKEHVMVIGELQAAVRQLQAKVEDQANGMVNGIIVTH